MYPNKLSILVSNIISYVSIVQIKLNYYTSETLHLDEVLAHYVFPAFYSVKVTVKVLRH